MSLYNLPDYTLTDEEIITAALKEIALDNLYEKERLKALRLRDECRCEHCTTEHNVAMRPALTNYCYEGDDPDRDPNRDWSGCDACWSIYESHWTEMWAQANAGRL